MAMADQSLISRSERNSEPVSPICSINSNRGCAPNSASNCSITAGVRLRVW